MSNWVSIGGWQKRMPNGLESGAGAHDNFYYVTYYQVEVLDHFDQFGDGSSY